MLNLKNYSKIVCLELLQDVRRLPDEGELENKEEEAPQPSRFGCF